MRLIRIPQWNSLGASQSLRGFAPDDTLEDATVDRLFGNITNPFRAPVRTMPDYTPDRYDKLMPIPTSRGGARAKPIPLVRPKENKRRQALLDLVAQMRRG